MLPRIADHHCVLAECTFRVDVFTPSCRSVWNFRSADWPAICEHVSLLDFSFIDSDSVDEAALKLTSALLSVCDTFVAKRIVVENASSHPWLNDRCKSTVCSLLSVLTITLLSACLVAESSAKNMVLMSCV